MTFDDKLHYFARHGVRDHIFAEWFRSLSDDDKSAALFELNCYYQRAKSLLALASENFVLESKDE